MQDLATMNILNLTFPPSNMRGQCVTEYGYDKEYRGIQTRTGGIWWADFCFMQMLVQAIHIAMPLLWPTLR